MEKQRKSKSCPPSTKRRKSYTHHYGTHAEKVPSACVAKHNLWLEFLHEHRNCGHTREQLVNMYQAYKLTYPMLH
jgi:hypothetical protein